MMLTISALELSPMKSFTDFTTASRPADFVCAFAQRDDPTRLPLDLDDFLTGISAEA
jgi:hypothetical protein